MEQFKNVLDALDNYFDSVPDAEIKADIQFINMLEKSGPTLEGYLEQLDSLTAFSMLGSDSCDDIEFSEFFNTSIYHVSMSDDTCIVKTMEPCLLLKNYEFDIIEGDFFPQAA